MQYEKENTQSTSHINDVLVDFPPPDHVDVAHEEPQAQAATVHFTTAPASKPPDKPWPDPQPIKSAVPAVSELTANMIPEAIRSWLVDIAHRMQCPLDYVAATAVVAASSVVGNGCAVRPKRRDDWTVIPNLWGGIVAPPGMLKSPAMAEVLKPLARLEADAKEEYEIAMAAHAGELELQRMEKEALKDRITGQLKKSGHVDAEARDKLMALTDPEAPTWRRYSGMATKRARREEPASSQARMVSGRWKLKTSRERGFGSRPSVKRVMTPVLSYRNGRGFWSLIHLSLAFAYPSVSSSTSVISWPRSLRLASITPTALPSTNNT